MNPRPVWAKGLTMILMVSAATLQGCATRQNPDPFETVNRKVFSFNDTLDEAVLQPVARGYKSVTPQPVRTAISNFGGNFKDLWTAVNLFLQGQPGQGATQIMRVSVNSTLGLAGLIDIATPMRLERRNEDFGQTLGVWGVPPGAYIVWPLLGSSTARDSLSIPGDMYFSSRMVISDDEAAVGASILQLINARAALLDVTNLLGDVALDKYSFVRDGYLQRRQSLIYDGEPPEQDEDEDYDSEPAADPPESQSKVDPGENDWPVITLAELQGLRADEFVR